MEPPSATGDTNKIAVRSSIVESIRGCGLSGMRIDKEDLKKQLAMPQYLRFAMRDSIRLQDPAAGESRYLSRTNDDDSSPPSSPMVVFINPKSGGRHGPALKERLQQLISDEQVFDLSDVKPHEFVRYGLGCLEMLAAIGDTCAKETREKIRVLVAGGDGTVGWVLGCLVELRNQGREPVPPVAIVPLGTGNDLSRSFHWGGSFPFAWKSAIKRTLLKASIGPIHRLDSWRVSLSMPDGTPMDPPHSLKHTEDFTIDQGMEIEGELPEKMTSYEGVFYNYFSIGMDAQVAYGFHHLRNEKPYIASGPITNKIIYSGYSCTQGWFFTPCTTDPGLRGLKNILRMHIRKVNCSEWEQVPIPSSVRAIVALNLHSYGSGRDPWGKLKPEYLEKRGFVEADVADGLLEIFGLKQGWHASFVMVELISAKHIAQAAAIRLEVRGGEWKNSYMQMDGEPWKQPLSRDFSTVVEIKREPFQSLMVSGE
ncbi:diacylglycerol kinase 7-like [Arachis stenosperma]|uniref:diacylglycerol kinase 7-like n=1 Tax=Arachis stenosperma TaxID=217475 RepID=UPI0025AC4225|nr:diacylglycerol kinase 7-like [Arachis stenosperma]